MTGEVHFYCCETIFHDYEVGTLFRVIDYILCGALLFGWFDVMSAMAEKRIAMVTGLILAGLDCVTGSAITILFSDGYYEITNGAVRQFLSVFEGILLVAILAAVLKSLYSLLIREVDMQRKIFLIINSIAILFWKTNETVINIGLYSGDYGISAWALKVFDPTSLLMLAMSLNTMIFVFKEDVSPAYRSEAPDEEDILSILSAECALSVREAETMRLVYDGYSNLEIADEMNISVNTVKKHTKNIYSKMGVTSRMDLVHFINERKEKR